jgi:5'-nucleotidase
MAYACRVDGRLVTSAGRYGTMLTHIRLELDRASGDVVKSEARNVVVRKDTLVEDPAQVALVESYRALAKPLMNRPAGSLVEPLPNTRTPAGESPTGLLIADAMREGVSNALGQPIDVALMNPGGVRSDFPRSGEVTYGDIFTVQPFGNDLVALTLTGAQIEAVLAQQFGQPGRSDMVLQVSDGFSFRWRRDAAGAGALVPGSVRVNGAPLEPGKSYRVATNNFLATGGDGFTAFSAGRDRELAGGDASVLAAYIRAHAPVPPPKMGRVVLE